jgi:phosphoribosylamine--glycine ligase
MNKGGKLDFMNSVLIVGSGGREHAILKAMLRSDRPLCFFAYPGNPGMEQDGCMLVDKKINDFQDLADWANQNDIDLTVVGPETPLAEGIVDVFKENGLTIFGPTKRAAELESSKEFSKGLMKKYGIPTAKYEAFNNKEAAFDYLHKVGAPIVIKASGLAAGKGVIVCDTIAQAEGALNDMFDNKVFGSAASTVIMEEKMTGEEASIFVLSDGKNYRILPVAQDHKAIGDGDTGPNTGGMGAYAPAPVVTKDILHRVEQEIIIPVLDAMHEEDRTYRGLLYCGIMITGDGPKVIEFNCRFGDPETQAVLPLVKCDWYEIFKACAESDLHSGIQFEIDKGYCVSVILASKGYPGNYEKGKIITGIEDVEHNHSNIDVYHSGTILDDDDHLLTNGGRVCAVTAWSDNLADAIADAYIVVNDVRFEGKQFRRDIGAKGLARLHRESSMVS